MKNNKKPTTGYPLLSTMKFPEEIKYLDNETLSLLCTEVRSFLIRELSLTGGHVASNLGAVELITAIHKSFDTSHDRLVFDVGHQCYTHKIYTGRMDDFHTLRKGGGLSGFPKPEESVHDAFIAGHGSTAISVALGLARADKMQKNDKKRHFIALVGDGAMTGGMAYEGLNDAGGGDLPLIVILNDNGMSIDKSVGAISRMLTRFRVEKKYRSAKETYHKIMDKVPCGNTVDRFFTNIKDSVKHAFIKNTFFESLGFEYIGPVDGHNIVELTNIFEQAKTYNRPVLIHAVTQKGKGYCFSEGSPENYHGVDGFDIVTGSKKSNGAACFSKKFGTTLCRLACKNKDITAITAAMQAGSGLCDFSKRFPDRYYDVGIAEEHGVTMAAGMAAGGMRPFVAIYSTFLQRSFDQIMHDVGIMGLPVVFCIDRAGLVGEDGETHQGIYDLAMLSAVPGMSVYMPSNTTELSGMLERVYKKESGPCAIRYPRGLLGLENSEEFFAQDTSQHDFYEISKGSDMTIVASGRLIHIAAKAVKLLNKRGIEAGLVKLNKVSPVPTEGLSQILSPITIVCEEVCAAGSAGERLSSALCGKNIKVLPHNCGNRYIPQGSASEQLHACGLDVKGIVCRAKEAFDGR